MHFGARAGQADARRRDAGAAAEHRRGAATPQMPARPHLFAGVEMQILARSVSGWCQGEHNCPRVNRNHPG